MLAAISVMALSTNAFGIDEIDKCASEVDHAVMRKCLEDAATRVSNELIKTENKMVATLQSCDEDQQWRDKAIERFKIATKAFRTYQKEQCDFESSTAAGGNAAGDLRAECIYRLAKERTKFLLEQEKNLKQ
jgi:uncharacterized protein YecT (DUF1311 family)